MADKLGLDFALIHRKHTKGTAKESEDRMELLVGNVKGKTAILVDDMIDTGTTISLATVLLKEAGADKIYVIASHGTASFSWNCFVPDHKGPLPITTKQFALYLGVFSETNVESLIALPIEKLVVTNTIPQAKNQQRGQGRIDVLDVSPTLAESIRRSHNGESINILFDHA